MFNQLTAEQRIEKAVVAIMEHPRYMALAGVLMIGDKTVHDDIPTACTNGRDVMFGRAFVDSLTDAELRGLILHEEEGHKLYRHLTTWRWMYEKDPEVANIACDYVINIKLYDDNAHDGFAKLPECGLLDEKYRGMDEAQVFNLLYEEKDRSDPSDPDGDGDDDGEPSDGDGGTGIPMDSHDWEGAKEMSQDEQDQLERDVDEAIRQGAMAAGKMSGGEARGFDDLLKPQVDWREVLREFIQNTCAGNDYATYARPNRRLMSQGIIMPSGVSEQVGELIDAIDTSGSIGQGELNAFMSEVKAICDTVKPEKLRQLYWGSSVVRDESYEMHELDDMLKTTKPVGGGGTDVNCVTEYMTEHSIKPQAVIVLTDGHLYNGWGEWSCPVLWVILDNEHAVPTNGKCLHINSRELR